MKKRKNIINSAITCMMSICLMMIGVYAATNPSVSISGQVSYTARDAKVLVQGKINGIKDQTTAVDYPSATVTANDVTATKVTDSATQYLDYTQGTSINDDTDNLSNWNIGVVSFVEDSNGPKDIVVSFRLTNLSTYPVQASITFGKTDAELLTANVTRTAPTTGVYLPQNGGNSEVAITYSVKDDSQSINANDLLNMNIKFEKTAFKIAATTNSISEINGFSGMIAMGKQSADSTVEDIQWRCFAYSTDGETWTKLDSGQSIPVGAKYGYFILDTYISSLGSKQFLSSDKYNKNSDDSKYYINAGTNGVTEANTVYANDYYYSDIRQTLKGLESTLSISTDSEIYKAIQGRTMTDLYGKMSSINTDVTLPTGADASDTDTFWLMSRYEANTYFADNDARKWLNGDSGKWYWLRSRVSSGSNVAYAVSTGGGTGNGGMSGNHGARAAFKLQLA